MSSSFLIADEISKIPEAYEGSEASEGLRKIRGQGRQEHKSLKPLYIYQS